jgi:hypothetical protein
MRQIENFDFDPQNKIRICCLARSLQARSLRQQLRPRTNPTRDLTTWRDFSIFLSFLNI